MCGHPSVCSHLILHDVSTGRRRRRTISLLFILSRGFHGQTAWCPAAHTAGVMTFPPSGDGLYHLFCVLLTYVCPCTMYPCTVADYIFQKCITLDIQRPGKSCLFPLSMSVPCQHRRAVHLSFFLSPGISSTEILEIIKARASRPVSHAHVNSFDYIPGDAPGPGLRAPGSEPVSRR